MNAEQAADLTAVLRPHLTIPRHYAVTSRPVGDRLHTKVNRNRPCPDA